MGLEVETLSPHAVGDTNMPPFVSTEDRLFSLITEQNKAATADRKVLATSFSQALEKQTETFSSSLKDVQRTMVTMQRTVLLVSIIGLLLLGARDLAHLSFKGLGFSLETQQAQAHEPTATTAP